MLRDVTSWLVGNLVELLMFSVGLRASATDVMAEVRRPALLARELVVLAFAVPLITLLVIRLLEVPAPASVVFVLFGICPAAPYVLYGFQKRGSAASKALAVVGIALAMSVIMVPTWVWILNRYLGYELRVSAVDIASILVLKVFLPLLLGMFVRRIWRKFATIMGPILNIAVVVALVVSEVLLFRVGSDTLQLVTIRLAAAALLVSALSALLGELAGGRDTELGEILGMAAVSGNPSLALAVIAASDPTLKAGGVVAAYLLVRAVATIPYKVLTKVRYRSAQKALSRASR
jgi:BASS family bile acid:Na+ symporter